LRRAILVLTVLALVAAVSGVSAFMVPEPCTLLERAPEAGGDCMPTCPTCGCCAQVVVQTAPPADFSGGVTIGVVIAQATSIATAAPRAIFHVPKPLL